MHADLEPRPVRGTDNHYVILVHGTFNKPEPGTHHWAVLDSATPESFAHQLDDRLRATRIGSAVNKVPGGDRRTFAWTAGNTDADRRVGARNLLLDIAEILRQVPNARIDLAGHSHGGNVILAALEQYYATLARRADHNSGIPWFLTLGSSAGAKRNDTDSKHRLVPARPASPHGRSPMPRYLRGSKGEEVCRIQAQLKELGLYPGAVDGDFGGGIEIAVRRFQRKHRLASDGIVGRETWGDCFPVKSKSRRQPLLQQTVEFRCLSLTGAFETSAPPPECFARVMGDFDGQGISFGALQFNNAGLCDVWRPASTRSSTSSRAWPRGAARPTLQQCRAAALR